MTVIDERADQQLKGRHRAMWASGDYPALAREVIAGLGPVVVEAAGSITGRRVLDIAAGSGNASLPAARAGADVVASDLAPELLAVGRAAAEAAGLSLQWLTADAEHLPFADDEFDAAISCVGIMFAPHHELAAAELTRVVRPGGRVALLNWTPEGFIGRMFATLKPFAPPPPPGAQPAPRWGQEAHVRELLGERAEVLEVRRRTLRVTAFASGEEFRDYFKSHYGPTISVYRHLGEDAARIAELDAALAALARDAGVGTGTMEWEYLLLTARVV